MAKAYECTGCEKEFSSFDEYMAHVKQCKKNKKNRDPRVPPQRKKQQLALDNNLSMGQAPNYCTTTRSNYGEQDTEL